ncbi:hypothetical protein TGDOM2_398460 [Toxoplasma gondii GAB2-2007-GAL-DOM2]|uniref:Uncharacterized protein n=1 Tax=Toxoplasma gondii GAB2-2007-GAL-DOM2 TaxID=1130820 RepID=A0A086KJ62_TOXGO|nr:hypothetical protein TGDOM2_398460 [Toxoplasma gondii GAB2-2007-GAL-DOM2]
MKKIYMEGACATGLEAPEWHFLFPDLVSVSSRESRTQTLRLHKQLARCPQGVGNCNKVRLSPDSPRNREIDMADARPQHILYPVWTCDEACDLPMPSHRQALLKRRLRSASRSI